MSKLKVGDRVLLSGTVDIVCTGEDIYPYKVTLDEGEAVWLHAETKIRRIVKRKRPKPASPDRVMVAARLLAGMLANPSGPIQSNEQSGWESLSQVALDLADDLIAEGAK